MVQIYETCSHLIISNYVMNYIIKTTNFKVNDLFELCFLFHKCMNNCDLCIASHSMSSHFMSRVCLGLN